MTKMKLSSEEAKGLKEKALAEVREELEEEAKDKLKEKIREIQKAKRIVHNLEREIEDLELELTQDGLEVPGPEGS